MPYPYRAVPCLFSTGPSDEYDHSTLFLFVFCGPPSLPLCLCLSLSPPNPPANPPAF